MRKQRSIVASATALLVLGTLYACGSSPTHVAPMGSSDSGTDASLSGSGAGAGNSSGGSGSGSSGQGNSTAGGSGSLAGNGPGTLADSGAPGPNFYDGSTFFLNDAGAVACSSGSCPQCYDGIDNDNDGKIDGWDEECSGPIDNDEGSFATGIPGDNQDPKWQDCFFDGNSGAGDDGCRYSTDCLTGDLPSSDKDCTLSQGCIDYCKPLTPNGCDCFGCCEIATGNTSVFVRINSTCDFDNITDETLCPPCVQTDSCVNTCGECELCPGKGLSDLPDTCFTNPPPPPPPPVDGGMQPPPPPPPGVTCDNGFPVCATQSACAAGDYCQLGCCVPSGIQ